MRKTNTKDIAEDSWTSPKGKFAGFGKSVSIALGRKETSTDLHDRHPFDLEILRLAPGQTPYPYHLHSAQWELYHVISGNGIVRHQDGTTEIEPGDAFVFGPDEPHHLGVSEDRGKAVQVAPFGLSEDQPVGFEHCSIIGLVGRAVYRSP